MTTKIFRFSTTIAAIGLGILLIAGITYLGNEAKGPFEDIFVSIGAGITSVEGFFIKQAEKNKRAKSLAWFDTYRRDISQLKNPDVMLLGAFDNRSVESFQPTVRLEKQLGTHFPILHVYSAWGSKPEQRFPLTQLKAIHELGSIPLLTWEPWLVDFDATQHSHLRPVDERDKGGLSDIAAGKYDFYLEKWVADLKRFGQPLFIRLGHEMNDPYRYTWGPQNNAPEDFVAAWRYVVDYFRQRGVDNVLWVWSPHIAYGLFNEYYPGDGYVDWIGVGTLNYGTVASWSQWWSFDEVFGNHYAQLDQFGKPLMATEFGSLAVGGDRLDWYKTAFCEMPEKYPNLKSVLFFHFDNDNTLTYKALDWYIVRDTSITQAITGCLENWAGPRPILPPQ